MSSQPLGSCNGPLPRPPPCSREPQLWGSEDSGQRWRKEPLGEGLGQPPGISEQPLKDLRLGMRRNHPFLAPGHTVASGNMHCLCVFLLLRLRERRLREVHLTTQGHTACEVVRGETMEARPSHRRAMPLAGQISLLVCSKWTASVGGRVRAALWPAPGLPSESVPSQLSSVSVLAVAWPPRRHIA